MKKRPSHKKILKSNSTSSQEDGAAGFETAAHPQELRLSRLLSLKGLTSRRRAEEWITKGFVRVDGEIIDSLGVKVLATAQIQLDPRATAEAPATVLLHKPVGYIAHKADRDYPLAVDLIRPENQVVLGREPLRPDHFNKLAPAGRLDIDSRGLMVFTQSGVVAKQLIGPDSQIEKEYEVGVEGILNESILKRLRFGIQLDGVQLKRANVWEKTPGVLGIVLVEGRNRQIRRMCQLVDLKIKFLKRLRIGQISLRGIPEGQWRFLQSHERF